MKATEEKFVLERRRMVETQLLARGIFSPGVVEAFAQTPREVFVPAQYVQEAYEDHPVGIGSGQTISQPYIVALTMQELDLRPHHRVLEIGAGSGYQTALLARLVQHVYAMERLGELAERAMAALGALGVSNITMLVGDGSVGWPEEAPFDRIVSGAAAPVAPQPWIDQLADGGRIVLPVGGDDSQMLTALERRGDRIVARQIAPVRFVKLIGREGWPEG